MFFLTVSIGAAQCPFILGITTQEEIDSFAETYPNCTGSGLFLDINGQNSNITNLNGLSQLTSIVRLGIFFTDITDLSGLENITDVYSGIFILANNGLTNLEGLNSLQTVGDRLRVVLNTDMTSLEGLESLTQVGGEVGIELNGQLKSLSGLNNLSRVGGTFKILSQPSLPSLAGLESLEEVGGASDDIFDIFNNPLLEDLAGLENLRQVNGILRIRGNNGLLTVNELNDLEDVRTRISFESNPLLSFCAIDVICNNLENSGVELVFEDNAFGCSTREEVEDSCRQLSVSDANLSEKITLFPNPVSNVLRIETANAITIQQIKLYTTTGAKLISTSKRKIDLSNLSTGIYLLQAITNEGILTRKIVKE